MVLPIPLAAPLAWKSADADALRMLQSLQGNILKGHGRHFGALVFFRLDPTLPAASRRFLRDLGNHHVTNAHQQLVGAERFKACKESAGPFVHVALSQKGYEVLGVAPAQIPNDPDFARGMKNVGSVQGMDLKDPPPAEWEVPFRDDLHGVVLVAHDTPALCGELAGTIRELVREAGATVVHVQHGAGLFNSENVGIEHFGYVDGRSQPLMLEEDIAAENKGEGMARWSARFGLDAALIPDPGVTQAEDRPFSFGSYFVFRKLEQNVRSFKRREQQLANDLKLKGSEARELAGALVVGRFEDGTPVTLSDEARGGPVPNDFDYGDDPGRRCPFHAHIRKTNPRGSDNVGGPGGPSETAERRHLMPRRGLPYEDVRRAVHPEELPEVETLAEFNARAAPLLPTGGVGLLFMAYNRSIGEQFRFTQQAWVNSAAFPRPGTHGIDPLIGQGPTNHGDQKMFKTWDDPASPVVAFDFDGFVRMKGGEYFFSPSLNFLREL